MSETEIDIKMCVNQQDCNFDTEKPTLCFTTYKKLTVLNNENINTTNIPDDIKPSIEDDNDNIILFKLISVLLYSISANWSVTWT